MKKIDAAIKAYQDSLRAFLHKELEENGGSYQKWYDDLEPFREYIVQNYVRLKLAKELYWYKGKKNKYEDVIDHHIISYLAPLEYIRIGWDGMKMRPYEQILKTAKYLSEKGRFINVALPNKGFVYPHLACDVPELYNHKTMPAPQYRKHISDLLDSGIEVVDLYPVFKEWADFHKEKELLFSKDHHISPVGAKLIADTLAEYLRETTDGLDETMQVNQSRYNYYDNSASANNLTEIYVNYTEDDKTTVWHQNEGEAYITIFGDCNLQSYQPLGAGIHANLVYDLQLPIHDRGRVLLFDDKRESDNKMSLSILEEIKESEIMIYVAFCSAGFVRTSQVKGRLGLATKLLKEHLLANYKWANFNLSNKQ